MAFNINSTTVITDNRDLNNIIELDSVSGSSVVRQFVTGTSLETGTTVRASRDTQIGRTGTGPIFIISNLGLIQKGTVNFYFESYVTNSLGPASVVITRYRNGSSSAVFTQSVSATSYTAYNTDQSVLPGDRFDITLAGGSYSDGKTSVSTTGYIRNLRMRTASTTPYFPIYADNNFYFALSQ